MKTLYVGGTGEISYSCIHAGAALGHQITVFNRGLCAEPLPPGTIQITGDLTDDASYRQLAQQNWDVVCQFKAYDLSSIQRDVDLFSGKVGQYVFISSASVYSKPLDTYIMSEKLPIGNKFWAYSDQKAQMERALMAAHQAGKLPVTIVRPSHTYRRNFPGAVLGGDESAWRMLQGKPLLLHGDGTSIWTLTHADDFARPFVRLLGNAKSLGESFHLTAHMQGYTWNKILTTCARALGVEPRIVHVPTDTLICCRPELEGNLRGDKAWPALFDNSKVRAIVGEFVPQVELADGLRAAAVHVRRRMASFQPDSAVQNFADQMIVAQEAVTLH